MTDQSSILGNSTLLLGKPGSGKTYSLPTYVEAGLELFVLITDPRGEESLLDSMSDRKLPMDKLHYHYVPPANPSWDTLKDMAFKIEKMGYKDLAELKTGVKKEDFQQFPQLLGVLSDFICQRDGKSYGPVDTWGPDRALAVDSMSGISTMAFTMMVGAKPTAHMGEWGVAMNAELRLLQKLASDVKCFLTITGHIETEMDETIGRPQLMLSALGKKNAPKIPKDFSDVVYAYREGTDFFWSTVANNIDLKTRTLPLKDKIKPDFGQMVTARNKRVAMTTNLNTETETKTS